MSNRHQNLSGDRNKKIFSICQDNKFTTAARKIKITGRIKIIKVDEYDKKSLFRAYTEMLAANRCGVPFTTLDSKSSKEHKQYINDACRDIDLIDDCCVIFFTSGSTGRPRPVQKTNKQIINVVKAEVRALGLNKNTIFTNSSSLNWCMGVYNFFWYCYLGAKYEYIDKVGGYEKIIKQLVDKKINFYPAIGYHWHKICKILNKKDIYLPAKVVIQSSAVSVEVIDTLLKRTKCVFRTYGTTESTAFAANLSLPGAKKEGVGKAIDDTKIKIINEDGRGCAPYEVGEIQLSGPQISLSVSNPYNTGDLGYLDCEGCLFVMGRKDAQFKVAGIRVNPDIIEGTYKRYNAVAFGRPSFYKDWKEVVIVFETEDPLDVLKTYVDFVTPPLSPFCKPQWIMKLNKFPKTKSGKVDRIKIEKQAIEIIKSISTEKIETRMNANKKIKACKVFSSYDAMGRQSFYVYYVAHSRSIEGNRIKKVIAKSVSPDIYVSPLYFYQVSKLPLTQPDPQRQNVKIKPVAANTEIQKNLVLIWQKVLGRKNIGIDDELIALGAESLKVYEMVMQINKSFGVDITVAEIFRNPTIRKLAMILSARQGKKKTRKKTNNKRRIFPLAVNQKRIWTFCSIFPDTPLFNMPIIYRLKGKLDIWAMQKSLTILTNRHGIFKTNLILEKNKVVQKIRRRKFQLQIIEFPKLTLLIAKNKIRELLKTPIDLEKDPLLRAYLLKSNNACVIFFNIHHIIMDVWSHYEFYNELFGVYEDILNNKNRKLPKPGLNYFDYSLWTNSKDFKELVERQERFWLKYHERGIKYIENITDKTRPEVQTHEGLTYVIKIDKISKSKLEQVARDNRITVFTLLFYVYFLFFYKITGQRELHVGTPVSNRDFFDAQSMIGFFLNTIVIKCVIKPEQNFVDALRQFGENILKALENKEYPFDRLISQMSDKRDVNTPPLVNTFFQFVEARARRNKFKNISVSEYWQMREESEFDLTLQVVDADDKTTFRFNYNKDIFYPSTIRNYAHYFKTLLLDIIDNPKRTIRELNILLAGQRNMIMNDFNDTKRRYDKTKGLAELFIKNAERYAQKTAVVCGDEEIKYYKLNDRSNQLARWLKSQGVNKGDRIAVIMSRGCRMVIAMTAILKLGAIYIPLSTYQPRKRLQRIIDDVDPLFIISELPKPKKLDPKNYRKLILLDREEKNIARLSTDNLIVKIAADKTAAIIYTSGSTGKPKGVMLSHQGIINHAFAKIDLLHLCYRDTVSQNLSCVFVASLWQFFAPLLAGAKCRVYTHEISSNPQMLLQHFNDDKVTIASVTPSFLDAYLNGGERYEELRSLKTLIVTGENLRPSLVALFYRHHGYTQMVNAYGQTECSDDTMHFVVPRHKKFRRIPIGRPIRNTEVYIMNQDQSILPIGISGEIFIAGDSLAQGYYRDKRRTQSVFLSHPFRLGEKIFKTGDRGCLNNNGEVEFLGRLDRQIKIEANRVEAGEIEYYVKRIASVVACLVVYQKISETRNMLVAYYTANKKLDEQKMKNYLKKHLPNYMVPQAYVKIKELPRTLSGKVNLSGLPSMEQPRQPKHKGVKKMNRLEKDIFKIWKEILGTKSINPKDSFFMAGGQSLAIIMMLNRVNEKFKTKISITDFINNPTIMYLAQLINKSIKS